jgi:hypothetical protein
LLAFAPIIVSFSFFIPLMLVPYVPGLSIFAGGGLC